MKLAYVSGKYSDDRGAYFREKNIQMAHEIAAQLWSVGIPNVCPHANTYHMDGIADYDTFIDGDLIIVERSDLIIMMPNWESSRGAKIEREHALKKGVPVFHWPEEFKQILEFCWPDDVMPDKHFQYAQHVLPPELDNILHDTMARESAVVAVG